MIVSTPLCTRHDDKDEDYEPACASFAALIVTFML